MEKDESNYNMIDWWKKAVFKNYANFRGRARRSEYWYFVLFNIILFILPICILSIIGDESEDLSEIGFSLLGIAVVGIIIPWLAVVVRRLHDLNKSGWYYFVRIIPIVGPIIILVWFCTEGDKFTNNYGDDPKDPGMPEFDFDQKS